MNEFLRSTPAQAVMSVAALLILIAFGAYVIQIFRQPSGSSRASANELLTDFRNLHDGGKIDGTEYGKIKSVLGEKLQDEYDGKEQTG